jgi:hypothetical protein
VVITAPGGVFTATGAYTYVAVVPGVTSLSPTSGPAAGGTSVTITGTDLTGRHLRRDRGDEFHRQ